MEALHSLSQASHTNPPTSYNLPPFSSLLSSYFLFVLCEILALSNILQFLTMIANNMMNYNTKPTALIHHYACLNLFLLGQSENAKETKG